MRRNQPKPDVDQVLSNLKDFQRKTVDYVHGRMYDVNDPAHRFLVADEMGLGKTLVARGVIAKTIETLWSSVRRIDVLYICSNVQIARQNVRRLNVMNEKSFDLADRITLLPTKLGNLNANKVNFVSFTPGTSFQMGNSTGRVEERVLLHALLREVWGQDALRGRGPLHLLRGAVTLNRFDRLVKESRGQRIDRSVISDFKKNLREHDRQRTVGTPKLADEFREVADGFRWARSVPKEIAKRRRHLVGTLRMLLARSCIGALEPDLVILDEFQRFKNLLDQDDPVANLAQTLFGYPNVRVLLLSATPYKMYTLPDEPEGDDHYADFIRTLAFLTGQDRARLVGRELHEMRTGLLAEGGIQRAIEAKASVESELRRVMVRTERLAATSDRSGMLAERPLPAVQLRSTDLAAYRVEDHVSRLLDTQDVLEFWKSAPYLLNFMEQYQLKRKFDAARDQRRRDLAQLLHSGQSLLSHDEVAKYAQLDPGNAKLRGVLADTVERGSWRLLWVPPSLPYYALRGAYGDAHLADFTKRLIFSAWAVVPKAVSSLVSYEAERRIFAPAGHSRGYGDRDRVRQPLRFAVTDRRPTAMPAFALLYPSVALAELGDPLSVAAQLGPLGTARTDGVLAEVASAVGSALARWTADRRTDGATDERWYWAAPLLLDQDRLGDAHHEWLTGPRSAAWQGDAASGEQSDRFADHVREAANLNPETLGRVPADLIETTARLALGGPGAVALRALSRVTGGSAALSEPEVRNAAARIAWGLRSLFGLPESVALLRGVDGREDGAYWRRVTDYCIDGCLQATLDEHIHVLPEWLGAIDKSAAERAAVIGDAVYEAVTLRTVTYRVDDIRSDGDQLARSSYGMRGHFALRFGRDQAEAGGIQRDAQLRTAFNSPFWPFVLTTTSVGQEGLDFHLWCHAVVHWNLPSNPVDLEQREGRVHRFKGHAVRKNVARCHRGELSEPVRDPWKRLFEVALAQRDDGLSDLVPYWVYPLAGGARIERYVPALPLSRDSRRLASLKRTLGAYRLVFGQPRQEDLLSYLGGHYTDEQLAQLLDELRIDLSTG